MTEDLIKLTSTIKNSIYNNTEINIRSLPLATTSLKCHIGGLAHHVRTHLYRHRDPRECQLNQREVLLCDDLNSFKYAYPEVCTENHPVCLY